MKKFFQTVASKLTANDNYNPDSIICPLHNFVTQHFEEQSYVQVSTQAIEGLQQAKTFFQSEQFQFKYRLLDQMINTQYLKRISELQLEKNLKQQSLQMLFISVEIVKIYHDDKYYAELINTAIQCNVNATEPILLKSLIQLVDLQPHFKIQINQDLINSVINYAQISQQARQLLYNKPFLFVKEQVLISVYAGLKNELTQIDIDESYKQIEQSVQNIIDLLKITQKYTDYSNSKEIREILQYSLEQIFILINRVCFAAKISTKCQLANYEEFQFENFNYCQDLLYLCAFIIQTYRNISIDLFKQAAKLLVVQHENLFYIHQIFNLKQKSNVKLTSELQISYIDFSNNNLQNYDLNLTLPQLVIICILTILKPNNETICIFTQIFNIYNQILGNQYLKPVEISQHSNTQTDFDYVDIIPECSKGISIIENCEDKTQFKKQKYLQLNGDLLAHNQKFQNIAQFSAGINRGVNTQIQFIDSLLIQQYLNNSPKINDEQLTKKEQIIEYATKTSSKPNTQQQLTKLLNDNQIPKQFSMNPIYQLCTLKMLEIIQFIQYNDFNGDEGAETYFDQNNNEIEVSAIQFSYNQIRHLRDFYIAASQYLYQLVLINPMLLKNSLELNIYKPFFDSIKKLSRLVAFIKANRTFLNNDKCETQWVNCFDEIINESIEMQKQAESAACGYLLYLMKTDQQPEAQ